MTEPFGEERPSRYWTTRREIPSLFGNLKWRVNVKSIRTKTCYTPGERNRKQTFLVTVTEPLQREGQRYLDFLINVNISEAAGNRSESCLLALAGLF